MNSNGNHAPKSCDSLQHSLGPLVVVGGHSRKIGKTSVIEALLRQTAHLDWTALKISAHRHSTYREEPFQLAVEASPGAHCDTARYLRAGATRALWLRANAFQLPAGVPAALQQLPERGKVLIESNRILDFVSPCLFLIVLDFSVGDFKESTRKHFHRADAFVVVERPGLEPPWEELPLERMRKMPVFHVSPGNYHSERLARFVEDAVTPRPTVSTPDAHPSR